MIKLIAALTIALTAVACVEPDPITLEDAVDFDFYIGHTDGPGGKPTMCLVREPAFFGLGDAREFVESPEWCGWRAELLDPNGDGACAMNVGHGSAAPTPEWFITCDPATRTLVSL